MTQLIEGIKFDLSRDELHKHLTERADHHRAKAHYYEQQVKGLLEQGAEDSTATNNPVYSLRQSQKSHAERVGFFVFIADHLIPGATYRLAEHDLTRLELLGKYL